MCKSKDGYCSSFCKSHLSGGNYKKDNMFLVENKEMVCSDCIVDYGRLDCFLRKEKNFTLNQNSHHFQP